MISYRFNSLVVAMLVFSTYLCGCGESDIATDPEKTADALRSLPYAAGSAIENKVADGVVCYDPKQSSPGYNLYSGFNLSMAELIDAQGTVINRWSYSPNKTWWHCELLANGDLLVIGADEPSGAEPPLPSGRWPDKTRYVMRLNWQGKILWKQRMPAHHDIGLTPEGKLIVLTLQRRLEPQIHPKIPLRDDLILLLEQDGSIVDSMSIFDAIGHNPQGFLPLKRIEPTDIGGSPWVDLFHANSVEWIDHTHLAEKDRIYNLDNVIVCIRHQDRVAIFNWTQRKLVWSWGRDIISGPHDAHVLKNGNVLVFDNGLNRQRSRGIEINPITERIVWEYDGDSADFYTVAGGAIERLPNGNTLMTLSDKGRAVEVTHDGQIVWEYLCPHEVAPRHRSRIVRMKRYPTRYVQTIIAEQRGKN